MLTVALNIDHSTLGQKDFKARAKLKIVPPEPSRGLSLNYSNNNNKKAKMIKERDVSEPQ